MNTGSHQFHGLWRKPSARQAHFNDVATWIDLVRTLEEGLFDTVFFADGVGIFGPVDGDFSVHLKAGLQIPNNDPSALLSALAVNTEHLGLAFTSSVLQSHPFEFARRVSTLDHISKGRIAWNIVTGAHENSARNFGLDRLLPHDERYEWAEEYLEVVFKLWEGSWDEGALLLDRENGVFVDPDKVHKIRHQGKRYKVEGPHLSAPSPQRTPLLFQAGSSPVGRAFAARYAEGQFLSPPNPAVAAELIAQTRAMAESYGRRGDDIKFFQGFSFIIGSTEAEARRKEEELESYLNQDALLVHANLSLSQDSGKPYPPETRLADIRTNGTRSFIDWFRQQIPDREATVADLGHLAARRHPRITGTPEKIADELAVWREAGIDGLNVLNWEIPGSYRSFVDHLLPVLQQRGLVKREYAPGTLRQKLFGADHISDRHAAAAYRGAFR